LRRDSWKRILGHCLVDLLRHHCDGQVMARRHFLLEASLSDLSKEEKDHSQIILLLEVLTVSDSVKCSFDRFEDSLSTDLTQGKIGLRHTPGGPGRRPGRRHPLAGYIDFEAQLAR
jgi:hypothetical protein